VVLESLGKYLRDPAPPPVTKPRVKRPYPGIFQAVALILLLCVVEFLVMGLAGGFSPNVQLESPRLAICVLVSFAIILAFGLWRTRASFSEVFPLTRVPWSLCLPIVLCVVGLYTIAHNVDSFIYMVYPPPVFIRHLLPDLLHAGGYWNAFLQVVVVAPLTEEFLFRGLILRGLLKRYGTVTAVVASAVLFGAFHANIWQFSSAVLIGLIFGWFRVETQSLLPCLFGHAFWNFFVLELFIFPRWVPSSHLSKVLKSVQFVPPWFVLVGACVFGVGLFLLSRRLQSGRGSAEFDAARL
jgi:CAAX protease family protein